MVILWVARPSNSLQARPSAILKLKWQFAVEKSCLWKESKVKALLSIPTYCGDLHMLRNFN
jgi:hypothetical protein